MNLSVNTLPGVIEDSMCVCVCVCGGGGGGGGKKGEGGGKWAR